MDGDERLEPQHAQVMNTADGVVLLMHDSLRGITVVMDWRTSLALAYRLFAASEVGASREGLLPDECDAVRTSALDQVRAEFTEAGETITWLTT